MAKGKKDEPEVQETVRMSSFLALIGRTGETVRQVGCKAGSTAQDLVNAAGISLRKGEVLERDGQIIELDAQINPDDIIFVTEDDDNGQ